LPENPNVLQRWAQQYHVSAANPFKLLAHVGADVPGAAQFIPPERLAEIQSEQHPIIDWISTDELRERLIQLRADVAAQRVAMKIGDHYDFALVTPADWRTLARSCALDEEHILGMLTDMARALPDIVSTAHAQARADGLSERVLGPLAQRLIAHTGERLTSITAARSSGPFRRRARPK
jgi:hypothetical protein